MLLLYRQRLMRAQSNFEDPQLLVRAITECLVSLCEGQCTLGLLSSRQCGVFYDKVVQLRTLSGLLTRWCEETYLRQDLRG